MDDEGLLNITQAAGFLGLSKHTLYAYVAGRQIPHYKLGARLLFDRGELKAWRDARRVPTLAEEIRESRGKPVAVK